MSKITSAIAALGVVAGLGVAALPLSSYAAESKPVTIRAMVNSSLAVEAVDDPVDLGTVNTGLTLGQKVTTVTVTGTEAKYNLGVMDYDADTDMVWQNAAGTTASTATNPEKKIPTITANTLSGGWGFRKINADKTTEDWAGMPAYNATNAATNLVSGEELTGGSVSTSVEFGVDITDLTLENGLYEDQVVFTATAAS